MILNRQFMSKTVLKASLCAVLICLLLVMAPVATFYEMLDVTRARKEHSRIFQSHRDGPC